MAISPSHHCYIRLENISSLSTQQQQRCTSTDVDTVSDFPATATSHSSLAVSFSLPESLHLNWRGWHPDLEVGREMLRCLNPDQNKQLSLTHGYEWGLIFGSQHRIRVSSTTSGAGLGFRATTDEFVGDEAWETFLEIQQSFAQDLQWETLNLIIG